MPELRQYLADRATPGRWVLEPDAATDRSEEELALEVVRESIFRRFYEGEQQGSQCPLACLCAGAHGCEESVARCCCQLHLPVRRQLHPSH